MKKKRTRWHKVKIPFKAFQIPFKAIRLLKYLICSTTPCSMKHISNDASDDQEANAYSGCYLLRACARNIMSMIFFITINVSHFTDRQTEVQKGQIICTKSKQL